MRDVESFSSFEKTLVERETELRIGESATQIEEERFLSEQKSLDEFPEKGS